MSISVLMSVYRSERPAYLARALESVWDDQTMKPDEIVLVEDGPLGDGLLSVVGQWKEKLGGRLNVLVNEENLGLTKSLNRGLAVAEGEYIARMDSDDISMPRRFESQADFLDSHPDVSILGGSLQEFDDSCENLNVRRYPASPADVKRYIAKASPLAHPTVMMRRSIFDDGLRYDERYRTSQDIALWFDALCAGYQISNLPEVTIKFRRDGDVFKRRSKAKARNEFRIYMHGIRRLYGLFSWRYAYPLARFIFRMMPVSVVKAVYGSNPRKSVLK